MFSAPQPGFRWGVLTLLPEGRRGVSDPPPALYIVSCPDFWWRGGVRSTPWDHRTVKGGLPSVKRPSSHLCRPSAQKGEKTSAMVAPIDQAVLLCHLMWRTPPTQYGPFCTVLACFDFWLAIFGTGLFGGQKRKISKYLKTGGQSKETIVHLKMKPSGPHKHPHV